MEALLDKLKEKYKAFDATGDLITIVFRNAQKQALWTAENNVDDCPYGTDVDGGRVEDTTKDWYSGNDRRRHDGGDITMKELVQLTLYFFDKLFYSSAC